MPSTQILGCVVGGACMVTGTVVTGTVMVGTVMAGTVMAGTVVSGTGSPTGVMSRA